MWPIPTNVGQLDEPARTTTYGTYTTFDLTGDRKPDLVFTYGTYPDNVGITHWLVFPNTGSGFGAAEMWPIPTNVGQLDEPARTTTYGTYTTFDLTGDRKPDLVFTNGTYPDNVGITHWLVFPNTGSGFGAAQMWPIPGGVGQLDEPARTTTYGAYTTFDLDGDHKPDLVFTSGPYSDRVGITHWALFASSCGS
jgi:hypothetical protein